MDITKILYNGSIYTAGREWSKVQAVALAGPKIAAAGTNEQILKYREKNTQVIDLQGKMVLPGFVDSHAHPFLGRNRIII